MKTPAQRLKYAREQAGFPTVVAAAKAHPSLNANTLTSYENGNRALSRSGASKCARAFNVTEAWLLFGEEGDQGAPGPSVIDVPKVSWVSAGQLSDMAGVTDLGEFPTVSAVDLPDGEWIALEVSGSSMDKVAPPGSIIFVNLKDRRLSPGRCYVVADETGATTFKRYKPGAIPPFQPASFTDASPPVFQGGIRVIGRVRRSVFDL